MANEILNSLLKEYEQKKMREEIAADNRKEELYTKIPRLKKLDNEINSYAISVTKNILNSKSYSLSSLSDKINSLKREKELILKENHIEFDKYYACGPEKMLDALVLTYPENGYLSFEARMGCGFGACMGCSCKVKTKPYKRICVEGPVLMSSEVIVNG